MSKRESDFTIMKDIFCTYIIGSPINRTLLLPVLLTMSIAKYLEVLGARQTKQISKMINENAKDFTTVFIYSAVGIASIFLVEMQSFLLCKSGQNGNRKSNLFTFKYFLNLEPEEFSSVGKGEITSTIGRKSQAVQDMIDVFTLNLIPTFLTLLFVSIEVFNGLGIDSMIIINACIVLYVITTIKITKWRNNMRVRLINAQNKSSDVLIDGLYNYETIFTNSSEDIELEKYNRSLRIVELHSTDITRSLYILNLAQRLIWWLMTIILVLISVYSSNKKTTSEQFVFLVYIISLIVNSLSNFGFMYGKLQTAIINARLTNLTSRKILSDGYRTAYKFENALEVKNLSIESNNKLILNNGSFRINCGDKVAIIGRNGCGKSTLLKSLVGLVKSKGSIEIDGVDVKNITDASFKRLIAYIPQNTVLFNDNLMQNIKYGNPKIYDEEVFRVSKDLGIHESILKLENGYSTHAGEQGKLLSGGERQKIAILRAVVKKPQILMMDESTSNLDTQSELKIFKKILEDENATVLAIIHNLQLLSLFDRILLVSDGKIKEIKDPNSIDLESWYSSCNNENSIAVQ